MPGKVLTSISSKCKNTHFKASIFFSNKQVTSASLMAIDSGKIHFVSVYPKRYKHSEELHRGWLAYPQHLPPHL